MSINFYETISCPRCGKLGTRHQFVLCVDLDCGKNPPEDKLWLCEDCCKQLFDNHHKNLRIV